MSDFKAFVMKYAAEANAAGQALVAIAAGIALPAAEANIVKAAADALLNAATNIITGADSISESVTIAEHDILAALDTVVPAKLQPLVNDAVSAAVAEATKFLPNEGEVDTAVAAKVSAALADLETLVEAAVAKALAAKSVEAPVATA